MFDLNKLDISKFDIEKLKSVLAYDEFNPLLFNTGLFLILFVVFIGIYALLRRSRNLKLIAVILFSLYFYYKSSAEYCFILLGVCVSDFLLGLLMEKCSRVWQKKLVVAFNVIMNVGMLCYFKYFNLLYETFANFSGQAFDPLEIVLPAGISFFTFRSISYMVDIYRGEIKACRSFMAYTFYLTFFPPLLAGPVVRAKDMLPQVEQNAEADSSMISAGFFLIMCGLIKKVIVADYLSQNFVDRVFDNPALYSGFENLMGAYGFTIQLYCDFSGYSDMAIGLALLLGYRFFDNFRSPFKAQNPTEFWHRWHISLSTWLRDYVYIPLGGNRCSKTRKNANLMTTMVVGGLWHGASWMYVIWGALHGMFLVGHKLIFPGKKNKKEAAAEAKSTPWWRVAINVFVTFNLVTIAFMFFRARSLEDVGTMFTQIATSFHASVIPQFLMSYGLIVALIIGALIVHFSPSRWTTALKERYGSLPLLIQVLILVVVLFLVIQFRQSDIVPFVYLQY